MRKGEIIIYSISDQNISRFPSVPTWIDELVDTNLDISTAKPLEVPSPVTLIVLSGLVIDVMPPATAVLILSLRAFIPSATVWSAPISAPPVIATPTFTVEPFIPLRSNLRPSADFDNAASEAGSNLTSITFSSVIEIAWPSVRASCLPPTDVCKDSMSDLLVLIWFKSVSEIKPEPSTLSTLLLSWLVTVVICSSKAVLAASSSVFAAEIVSSTCVFV